MIALSRPAAAILADMRQEARGQITTDADGRKWQAVPLSHLRNSGMTTHAFRWNVDALVQAGLCRGVDHYQQTASVLLAESDSISGFGSSPQ